MKKKISAAGFCLGAFLLLLLLVRTADVQAIGPAGTQVGLAGLNGTAAELLGFREGWYLISELLGYLALLPAAAFALLGAVQLFKRKKLFRVDPEILALGVVYALIFVLYLFFDKVAVNYRPVLEAGQTFPEASFPSSHTVLACVVLGSVMLTAGRYLRSAGIKKALKPVAAVWMLLLIFSRLFSGVHWVTDIMSGVLLSGALIFSYSAALERIDAWKKVADGKENGSGSLG